MRGKGEIKSKKAKLQEKREEKRAAGSRVIEVSSEQQAADQLGIQKRRAKAGRVGEAPLKYNSINLERLKRVEYEPNRALLDQKALLIEETSHDHPMQHSEARALFSYRIEGNEATKYVSDLYLEQRIKKIAEEEQARSNAVEEERARAEKEKEEEEGEGAGEVEERKRASRYFESVEQEEGESRLVKCFRCNKRGHIAKNCLEERAQSKCTFCLGEHHHHDCNSRSCFRCNELGHIAQECRATGVECKKCGKKGHVEKTCGAIIYLDYSRIKSDQEFRDKYSGNDLKRLRCMAGCADPLGHFNCHQYHNFHKALPFDSHIRHNDRPDHPHPHPHSHSQKIPSESRHRFLDYERKLEERRPSQSQKGKRQQSLPAANPYSAFNSSYQIAYSDPYHQAHSYYNGYVQPYRFQRRQERW